MAEIAGENAQALRRAADVNLEDFALAMQSYGLSWSTGRVGDFESGRAAPSLTTLLVVVAALSKVIGRPVQLADLFAGMGQVAVNDQLAVDRAALRAALSGEPVRATPVRATFAGTGTLTAKGDRPP